MSHSIKRSLVQYHTIEHMNLHLHRKRMCAHKWDAPNNKVCLSWKTECFNTGSKVCAVHIGGECRWRSKFLYALIADMHLTASGYDSNKQCAGEYNSPSTLPSPHTFVSLINQWERRQCNSFSQCSIFIWNGDRWPSKRNGSLLFLIWKK